MDGPDSARAPRIARALVAGLVALGASRAVALASAEPVREELVSTGTESQPPGKAAVPRPGAPETAPPQAHAVGVDPAEEEEREPRTHALLINGGGSTQKNYLSHLHHLQDMLEALRSRDIPPDRIHVFSSDGDDTAQDLAARGSEPPGFWLIEATAPGRTLHTTDLTNTVWDGVTLRPARLGDLRRWFAGTGATLRPSDTLLVFVTDHGSTNPDDPGNGLISLWNESLSVLEFRALLGYLRAGVRVVNVMSQCHSGAFADAMTPLNSTVPGGDVCGFYSTTSDRLAYGCYPEGRDRDRIGHAFRFIDSMDRHASLEDVQAAVLITDTSPDVPVRTSDLFLERALRDEATRRKLGFEALVDERLALAWKDRGRWEPEIRLLDRIGEVYGTSSARTLAELKSRLDSLESLSKELETYADRWQMALDDLRRDNLERFLETRPAWKERLSDGKIGSLDAASRKAALTELLAALGEFTRGRADVWGRLQDLRETGEDARSAKYRVDVRLASLLRMRALLIRVAGIELLAGSARPAGASSGDRRLVEMRRALEALGSCEASRIGTFDAGKARAPALEAPDPLPPFEEDLAAVRRALPSWLGVQFRVLTERGRETFDLARGAVMVDQVYVDGPASAAGLRPGDIILGPPDRHFTEPNQIREWTMTSPRDTPLALELQRDGKTLDVTVALAPYPTRLPALPAPPKAGDEAPRLGALRMVRPASGGSDDVLDRRHMVYFWATWCGPCKSALPDLMDWSRRAGVPVLAVSDEDEDTVRTFLETWTGAFPERVASDELRRGHQSYGVSGTPTFVLVDEHGKIEWRQVGYSAKNRLAIPGWFWPPLPPGGKTD